MQILTSLSHTLLILHYIAKKSNKVLHKARNATSKMNSILCLHFDERMFPAVEFLLFRNVTTNNSTIFTQDLHKTYFSWRPSSGLSHSWFFWQLKPPAAKPCTQRRMQNLWRSQLDAVSICSRLKGPHQQLCAKCLIYIRHDEMVVEQSTLKLNNGNNALSSK